MRGRIKKLIYSVEKDIVKIYVILEERSLLSREKGFVWNDCDNNIWIERELETPRFKIICFSWQTSRVAIFIDMMIGGVTGYRFFYPIDADALKDIKETTAKEAKNPKLRLINADWYDDDTDDLDGNKYVHKPLLKTVLKNVVRDGEHNSAIRPLFSTAMMADTENWVAPEISSLMLDLDMILSDHECAKELAAIPKTCKSRMVKKYATTIKDFPRGDLMED